MSDIPDLTFEADDENTTHSTVNSTHRIYINVCSIKVVRIYGNS